MPEIEVEQLWGGIQKILKQKGFEIFPSIPISSMNTRALTASWAAEQGVESFLNLAQSLGVRLIYAEAFRFTDDDISNANASARGHLGKIRGIVLAWAYEGILHMYQVTANWYSDLEAQEQAEDEAEEVQIQELAERLAREPAFQQARAGMAGRLRIAKKLFPDLTVYQSEAVVREAWVIYQNDVVPEQERKLVEHARSLLASGLSKTEVANQLELDRDRLARLLAHYSKY